MSVHGPEPGRAKPWKVAWRDGRQRSARFAAETQARAFDALANDAKAAWLAAGGQTPLVAVEPSAAQLEPPEGVYAYETGAGTRYRFNAGGTPPDSANFRFRIDIEALSSHAEDSQTGDERHSES